MDKLKLAVEETGINQIAIGGGVSANSGIRKTLKEAEELITEHKMIDSILANPILLHDTAFDWALILLTEAGDIESLKSIM